MKSPKERGREESELKVRYIRRYDVEGCGVVVSACDGADTTGFCATPKKKSGAEGNNSIRNRTQRRILRLAGGLFELVNALNVAFCTICALWLNARRGNENFIPKIAFDTPKVASSA